MFTTGLQGSYECPNTYKTSYRIVWSQLRDIVSLYVLARYQSPLVLSVRKQIFQKFVITNSSSACIHYYIRNINGIKRHQITQLNFSFHKIVNSQLAHLHSSLPLNFFYLLLFIFFFKEVYFELPIVLRCIGAEQNF